MGRFDDAIALYKKSQDLSGRVPLAAITYAKMNRREEAKEILRPFARVAELHAGDADCACACSVTRI